ncbi:unnamed protein product [Rotaria sp. Silwood2]|nr:unnamed protein product [Rotaria sp. Silwood2]
MAIWGLVCLMLSACPSHTIADAFIFVTINSADIHSPVALYFSDVDLDLDKVLPEALGTSYERANIIATHPVAAAKFFNCLIKRVLKSLVLGGVLGPVNAYFGTVENQDRGSLHLHLLIWLNHEFTPAQLLKYLEDIVKEGLDLFREEAESAANEVVPVCLPTPDPEFCEFPQMFRKDTVLLVETFYKYSKGKSNGSKTCRMRIPCMLVKTSNIDSSTGQTTMR